MTLADLLADLKGRIGPGNIATDPVLLGWLNEAYMYMCDQIIQENPDYFNFSDLADLVANQWEYSLPTNASQITMVNANFTGTWRRLQPLLEVNQVPVLADPSQNVIYTELNPIYYITSGKIGVLPIPTQNVTQGLKLWFIIVPDELNSGDTPLFNKKYHRLMSMYAYANYLDLDDQHGDAERLRQRFEQRCAEMCESIGERQIDVPKSIEIVQDLDLYADTSYQDGLI